VYVALPLLLAAAFQLVARAGGLACSAILPFAIDFAGTRFPRQAGRLSGALIAFYQVGYGTAAFGVGPLRELTGLACLTVYSAAGALALALAALALTLAWRHSRAN
jgi:MFS transporter, FHS family, glucose/mannose:H+ symporter